MNMNPISNIVVQLIIRISYGSDAANLRQGDRFHNSSSCSSSRNAKRERIIKICPHMQSYCKNKRGHVFIDHGVFYYSTLSEVVNCRCPGLGSF